MSEQKQTDPDDWTDEPTGDGGSLGVPATDGHGMPAGNEVEKHDVVSGGGVVDRDAVEPDDEPESMTDLD
jgi:hypothetical protein